MGPGSHTLPNGVQVISFQWQVSKRTLTINYKSRVSLLKFLNYSLSPDYDGAQANILLVDLMKHMLATHLLMRYVLA